MYVLTYIHIHILAKVLNNGRYISDFGLLIQLHRISDDTQYSQVYRPNTHTYQTISLYPDFCPLQSRCSQCLTATIALSALAPNTISEIHNLYTRSPCVKLNAPTTITPLLLLITIMQAPADSENLVTRSLITRT